MNNPFDGKKIETSIRTAVPRLSRFGSCTPKPLPWRARTILRALARASARSADRNTLELVEEIMGKSSNSGGKQQDKNGRHHGGSQPKYSPNDDRSIVKNPTSKPYEQDKINQIKQTGGK